MGINSKGASRLPIIKTFSIIQANNLGGFRRIMPAIGNPEMYKKFIDHQATASVHKDTISTTQKKHSAAALRREINAKIKIPPPKLKRTKIDIPKNVFKSVDVGYLPNTIADWEEKERKMMMASRDFLVESCGIRAAICRNLRLNTSYYDSNYAETIM